MDYHYCGIVQFRGVHDAHGLSCGRYANTLCRDCGTSLCLYHTERCQMCGETFCESCLSFHQSEHAKSAQSDMATESPKQKTA